MIRSRAQALTLAAFTLLATSPARADGWARLPNGEWGYSQQVTTSGVFSCRNAQYYLAGGSCSAVGNILTLVSGNSSMTVTFTGTIQDVLATNVRTGPLLMGTFVKSFTGGPFQIPPMASRFAELFTFQLLLNSSNGTRGSVTAGYTSDARTSLPYNCCEGYATYTSLGIGAQPEGLRYSSAIFDTFEGRDISFDTTPVFITAQVGLVPEPATTALLAGGLLALLMLRPWRTRRETPLS